MADANPTRPARAFWWLVFGTAGVLLFAAVCWGLLGWHHTTSTGAQPAGHMAAWRAMAPGTPWGRGF